MANQIATAVLSLATTPFFLSHLGASAYGVWTTAGSFGRYWAACDLGFGSAVYKHMAAAFATRDDARCRGLFRALVRGMAVVGCAIAVSGVLFGPLGTVLFRRPGETGLFRILVLACAANAAILYCYRSMLLVLNAALRFDRSSNLELATTCLRSLAAVLLVAAGLGAVGMALGGAVSSATGLLLAYSWAAEIQPKGDGGAEPVPRGRIAGYAGISFAAQLGDIVRTNTDIPLVALLSGAAAVTHYAIASKIVAYIVQFAHAGLDILMPVFSRQHATADYTGMRETFLLATKISLSAGLFAVAGALLLARPFISMWVGDAYTDACRPLLWLTLTAVISTTQIPSANLLFGMARHRRYAALSWIEGALFAVPCLAIGARLGMTGVALARFLAAVPIRMVLQPRYACAGIGLRPPVYFRTAGRTMVFGGLAVAISAGLSSGASGPAAVRNAAAGMAGLSVLAAAQWFFAFKLGERRRITGAVMAALRRQSPGGAGPR